MAYDFEGDLAVGRSLESFPSLLLVDVLPGKVFPVDGNDAVSLLQSHPLGRSAVDDLDDAYGVVEDVELYPDAGETAFQRLHLVLHVGCTDIGRVWVELAENEGEGFFDQVAHVYRVDVLVVDDVEEVAQFVARSVDEVDATSCKMVGVEVSYKHPQDHGKGDVYG